MLPESFIQELRYRSDIESIVGSYVPLKRRGKNLLGLCPFHSEKTPSFTVYPENQSFYCFGCGAGGDIITFIRRVENLDYIEAIRLLAGRAGMSMPEDAGDDRIARLKTRVLEMNREAARFFHDQLSTTAGHKALAYLRGRGLTDRTIRHFGLGYSPDEWNELRDHLRGKGYSYDEMTAAALTAKGKNNSCYDLFRGRVMFPIIDLRGSVIGFGGRAMEQGGPKYLNSSDTPVFKKSRNLFSLNFAKGSKRPGLILCEGYMDVIAVHQGGFDNAVATLGTSLTAEQARLISQYVSDVVIAYDSDAAGQAAAKRAINLFDEAGVKVRVLSIPGAKDPDEFIKKYGAQRFDMLLAESANATEYSISRIRQKYNTDAADERVAFLKEFAGLLAEIRNPIEREVYAAKIAAELSVDQGAILLEVEARIKRRDRTRERKEDRNLRAYTPGPSRQQDPDRLRYQPYAIAEEKLLTLLLRHPDCYAKVAQQISPGDFVTETNRRLYTLVAKRLAAGQDVSLTSFAGAAEDADMDKLSWLLASEGAAVVSPDQADDLVRAILRFREQKDPKEIAAMDEAELLEYMKRQAALKRKR